MLIILNYKNRFNLVKTGLLKQDKPGVLSNFCIKQYFKLLVVKIWNLLISKFK